MTSNPEGTPRVDPARAHRILDRAADLLDDVEALVEAAGRTGCPLELTVLQASLLATRAALAGALNQAASAVPPRTGRRATCGYRAPDAAAPCSGKPGRDGGPCAAHAEMAYTDSVLAEVAAMVARDDAVDDALTRHVDLTSAGPAADDADITVEHPES